MKDAARKRRADFQQALAGHHDGTQRLTTSRRARRNFIKNDPKRLGTA